MPRSPIRSQTSSLRVPGRLAAAAGALSAVAAAAQAQPPAAAPGPTLPGGIEACAQARIDAERLACYDRFVAPRLRGSEPAAAAAPSAAASAVASASRNDARVDDSGQFLDELWELTPERKRGTFNFSSFRPNYLLPLHYTNRLNENPHSPSPGRDGQQPDYSHLEAKYQISLRTKLLEDFGFRGGDLWASYTQQGIWQIYSNSISRPFRAIDHEPELFYVVPTPLDLPLGFKLKMVGLGVAHQSNGQSEPLSRSWNRWYVLGGVENGPFALTARYNTRINETVGEDDNPDFTRYRGRAELLGVWSPGFYTVSALWRTNFNSDRGSLQLEATVPFSRKDPKGLRFYVQAFTGYAETLIDYNFRQTSVGAGVTLLGW